MSSKNLSTFVSSNFIGENAFTQFSYKLYTSEVTDNTGDWADIDNDTSTGFVTSLTPKSSNSKLLIRCNMHFGADQQNDNARWYGIRLYKKIGTGSWTHVSAADGDGLGGSAGTTCFISHTWGADTPSDTDYHFQIANLSGEYLDTATNSTDVHYYTLYWNARLGETTANYTRHLNRAENSTDAFRALPSSSISIEEIYIE